MIINKRLNKHDGHPHKGSFCTTKRSLWRSLSNGTSEGWCFFFGISSTPSQFFLYFWLLLDMPNILPSANFHSIFLHLRVAQFMCERQLIYRLIFNFISFKLLALPLRLHSLVMWLCQMRENIISYVVEATARVKDRRQKFLCLR